MHEVRVFNPHGKLTQTISSIELSAMFWKKEGIDPGNYRGVIKEVNHGIAKCGQCGIEFKKRTKKNRFCLKEGIPKHKQCQAVYNNAKQKVQTMIKSCDTCGKDFEGTGGRKFCNDPCYYR